MSKEQSHIEALLEKIALCNSELDRLIAFPEEANQLVNPRPYLDSDQFEITKRNKIELERGQYVTWLRRHLSEYNLGLLSSRPQQFNYQGGHKYIAFLDILGFSEIVNNSSQEEMAHIMSILVRDIQMGLTSEDVGKTKTKLYSYGFAPDLAEVTTNSILLSDTLVFWSNDDSVESFYALVKLVYVLMNTEAYYFHIALRGAITFGELGFLGGQLDLPLAELNLSSVYGKAIVEAYQYEKNQEWMGCLVTRKAIDSFMSQEPNEVLRADIFTKYIIEYDVPFKAPSGIIREKNHVIKWARTWEADRFAEDIRKCFTQHQKLDEIPSNSSVQAKFNNTIEFTKYVEQNEPKLQSDL